MSKQWPHAGNDLAGSSHEKRLRTHAAISQKLSALNEEELVALTAKAHPLYAGVGGRAVVLTIDDTPIFVKQIPLTDLERRPEHVRSTANLFGIPSSCHYGHGGKAGFGAWRELAANLIASGWVLSSVCANFPLLYQWRVLPSDGRQELTGDVDFWNESAAVRSRLKAIHDASAHLVLFCEYVPQNLLQWLTHELGTSASAAEAAVAFVDAHLAPTIEFMNAQGLTHFDTHFENIVTDGERLYFADFGLALSSEFRLTDDEVGFLARHRRYDYGRAAVGYVHCISAACLGQGPWTENLFAFLRTEPPPLPPAVATVLRREAPLALAFLEFSRKLREESRHTSYPEEL